LFRQMKDLEAPSDHADPTCVAQLGEIYAIGVQLQSRNTADNDPVEVAQVSYPVIE